MQPKCPVCRAPAKEGPTCYRCRADLSALFELRRRAAFLLSWARGEYRSGAFSRALALTQQSLAICRTDAARDLETLLLFRTGNQMLAYARWRGTRVAGDLGPAEIPMQITFPPAGEDEDGEGLGERSEIHSAPGPAPLPALPCAAETGDAEPSDRRGAEAVLVRAFSYVRNRLSRLLRRSR